jgi:type IV pilus assembly protein PilW
MSHPRTRHRGFTLTELLVALVAAALVIGAALSLMSGQQRLFSASAADRALQETGRVALDEITTNLRQAGYGVDPALAFDFGPLPGFPMTQAPPGPIATTDTYACASAVTCRDSTSGPDEIVFYARNPAFVRALAVAPPAGNGSLTLAGPLSQPLYQGQILQVMCNSGSYRWAYVTVAQFVAATASTATQVAVTLDSAVANQVPHQNDYLSDNCFKSVAPSGSSAATFNVAAKVYKVDRYRYYVASYSGRPYLMLEQGLKDANGLLQTQPIVPDVEDLQFSYLFPNSPAAAQQQVGMTSGTGLANSATSIDLTSGAAPGFTDLPGGATRTSQHPANIRGVSVAVVVRSPEPNPLVMDTIVPAAANRPATSGPTGYRRQLFQTTAPVRNPDANLPYIPQYSTSSTELWNVSGG